MAKITKLEAKTYNNKPSGFTVTLSDGRTGNVLEKESDKGLREGDEVLVTETPYTSKAGKESILYGLKLIGSTSHPQQSSAPAETHHNTPALPPKSLNVAQMKFDARMKVLDLGITALFGNRFKDQPNEEDATKEFIASWVNFADTLVDEIFTGR